MQMPLSRHWMPVSWGASTRIGSNATQVTAGSAMAIAQDQQGRRLEPDPCRRPHCRT